MRWNDFWFVSNAKIQLKEEISRSFGPCTKCDEEGAGFLPFLQSIPLHRHVRWADFFDLPFSRGDIPSVLLPLIKYKQVHELVRKHFPK